MSKRPAFQFYPSDWRTDASLRLCSIGARGLWIEMMCLMHEGEPYGHLTVQGRPIDTAMLARLVGESQAAVKRWIAELEANDVFSRTGEGLIFSRRMLRDEEVRERRAAGGQAGAEHGKKGAGHGRKGGRPKGEKTPLGTPLTENIRGDRKPPPSTSSSTSSPSSEEERDKSLSPRAVPDWLPMDEWRGFKAMRAKIKKPLTDRAAAMAIRKLGELRDAGHDPAAVLDQSTLHCWQDLYEIKAAERERSSGFQV